LWQKFNGDVPDFVREIRAQDDVCLFKAPDITKAAKRLKQNFWEFSAKVVYHSTLEIFFIPTT
jgi:hypothetical protein